MKYKIYKFIIKTIDNIYKPIKEYINREDLRIQKLKDDITNNKAKEGFKNIYNSLKGTSNIIIHDNIKNTDFVNIQRDINLKYNHSSNTYYWT